MTTCTPYWPPVASNYFRRQAQLHDFDSPANLHYDDYDDGGNEDIDLDAQFGSVSINATAATCHRFASCHPALPKSIWQSLTRNDQIVWDQMSDSGKKAIMFAYKDSASNTPTTKQSTPTTNQPTASPHKVNASETAVPVSDCQMNAHESSPSVDADDISS